MDIPPRDSLTFTATWPRERLQQLRKRGDPIADAVVAHLHATEGLPDIHDLLGITRTRAALPGAPPIYAQFLEHVHSLPSWYDPVLVEEGSQVLAAYMLPMYPSLLAGSLVGGAMFRKQATVVYLAGSLGANPSRRVGETGVMIARLALGREAVEPGGEAHEILARVRLLHAGLRHWLPASGRYTRTDEVPVNQHDLGITLALFGYVNLRSLRLLGVQLSRREQRAFMALWRYAGYVLGISEELLFAQFAEQEEFFLCSCIDEAYPTWSLMKQATLVLDAKARDFNEGTWGLIPVQLARTLLYQLTSYLMGSDYIVGMEIPDLGRNHWSVWLAWLFGRSTSLVSHCVPLGHWSLRQANMLLLRWVLLPRVEVPKGVSFGVKMQAKM